MQTAWARCRASLPVPLGHALPARAISTRAAIHKGFRSSRDPFEGGSRSDFRPRGSSRLVPRTGGPTYKRDGSYDRPSFGSRPPRDGPERFSPRERRDGGSYDGPTRFGSRDRSDRGGGFDKPAQFGSRDRGSGEPFSSRMPRDRAENRSPFGSRESFGRTRSFEEFRDDSSGRMRSFKELRNDRDESDRQRRIESWGRDDLDSSDRPRRIESWGRDDQDSSDRPRRAQRDDRGESDRPRRFEARGLREEGAPSRRNGRDSFQPSFEDGAPLTVPRTAAASTFLYGFNTVFSAMKAGRRKLYALYLQNAEAPTELREPVEVLPRFTELTAMAKAAGIPIRETSHSGLLNNISQGRPHNGVVLEASNIPAPPIESLGPFDAATGQVALKIGHQSREERFVNGTPAHLQTPPGRARQPLILFLDGITDPGNVGNIIRTAHFFGADAVVLAANTCANITSSVLAKASAGACEAIPIFLCDKPSNFLYQCATHRWHIYGAKAPGPKVDLAAVPRSKRQPLLTSADVAHDSPAGAHPTIVVLGAEGEGLRDNLQKRCTGFVAIEGAARSPEMLDVGVDSLNVSVAAGVLLEAFVRPAREARRTSKAAEKSARAEDTPAASISLSEALEEEALEEVAESVPRTESTPESESESAAPLPGDKLF